MRGYGREGGRKRDERTVDLAELLDADAGLEVDGAGDGGSTSEVPVGVVRRLLLEAARLDDVHVPRHLHLCEKEESRRANPELSHPAARQSGSRPDGGAPSRWNAGGKHTHG